MYIVTEVFDDGLALIYDIGTYKETLFTESEILRLCRKHSIFGVTVYDNKIQHIASYNILQFPSEVEAYEYTGNTSDVLFIQGIYWHFEPKNRVIHVGYYVMHYTEVETVFIGDKGYCGYIEDAKEFSREDAYVKCGSLNSNHAKKFNVPKSNYWTVYRKVG